MRNRKRNTCPPILTHFSGVIIVCPSGEFAERRTDIILGHFGILRRMSRDVVTHWNRPCDRRPSGTPIGKKGTWFLIFHFVLTFHVAEKLDRMHGSVLALEAEQRDHDDRQQNESDQKIFNHFRKVKSPKCRQSLRGIRGFHPAKNADLRIRSRGKMHHWKSA